MVSKIVDGDTLDVNDAKIRLALTNTPERGQPLYKQPSSQPSYTLLVLSYWLMKMMLKQNVVMIE